MRVVAILALIVAVALLVPAISNMTLNDLHMGRGSIQHEGR